MLVKLSLKSGCGRVKSHFIQTILAILIGLLFAGSGFAESAITEDESFDDFILEDTVVTATKTGETNLQQTAMSITALDADALKARRQNFLSDLSMYAPNTQVTAGPLTTVYIRGVGNNSTLFLSEMGVAVYIDGIYQERGYGASNSLYGVERVEVLRGPQGTLYGRNATGGAINIISKKPGDELEMSAAVDIAEFNRNRFDVSVSGPIAGDNFKGLIQLTDSQMDGFTKNIITGEDFDDENFTAVRGALEWLPTENLSILFRGSYFEEDKHYTFVKLQGEPFLTDRNAVLWEDWGLPGGPYVPPSSIYETAMDNRSGFQTDEKSISADINWRLSDDMSLRSITSFVERDQEYWYDATNDTFVQDPTINTNVLTSISQELHLIGKMEKFDWLMGLSYYGLREDFSQFWGDWFNPGAGIMVTADNGGDNYGVFGNAGFQLTKALKLTAGLRYSYSEKYVDAIGNWNPIDAPPFPVFIWPRSENEADWSAWTPKFGGEYQFSDDMMGYITISRGFKAGIVDPNNRPAPALVDPEYVWNYEAGLKSDWLDNRLRANLTLFWMEYTDMQYVTVWDDPTTPERETYNKLQNAEGATMRGIELEMTARPLSGLTLNTAVSYLNSEYGDFESLDLEGNLVNVDGNQIIAAPEFKIHVGAQYTLALADYGFLTFRGDIAWQSDIYYTVFEHPLDMTKDHTIMNGLVRFETQTGSVSVDFYCRNLADVEEVNTSRISKFPTNGLNVVPLYAPRYYGLQVTFNY